MAISKVIFPLSSFQGFRQQQVPLCSNCCSREESSSSHQWIVRSLIDWTSNFQFSFESNSQVHWFCLSTYIGGLEKKKAKKKGKYKWKKDINNLKKCILFCSCPLAKIISLFMSYSASFFSPTWQVWHTVILLCYKKPIHGILAYWFLKLT